MPRMTHLNRTEYYRLLIESFYDNAWHEQYAYGPYDGAAQCKATLTGGEHNYKDRYEKGTRRARIQKQHANEDREIEWIDVA